MQCVCLSLDQFKFYGYSFDVEILHHFMDLEIDEIYDFGYVSKGFDGVERFLNYENEPDLREAKFKNVIEILNQYEEEQQIELAVIGFTNGLYLSYSEGVLYFQIDNEKLFYEYSSILLKQYGFVPESVYEFTKLHPGRELFMERPGVLKAISKLNREDGSGSAVEWIT
jgi:hypothetical protein